VTKTLLQRALLALSLTAPALAVRTPSNGLLQVTVVDAAGQIVRDAQIFLLARESMTFQRLTLSGRTSLPVSAGHYRLYAALTKPAGDSVDRYISPEAFVQVSAADSSSVILRIAQPAPPRIYLSEYTRKKIGLTAELAQFVN
jgi:hypothetical protein